MDTFRNRPFPTDKKGVDAIRDIYRADPKIFLCIARKKNGNVMVYRAILHNNGYLRGIEMFWLDLEPSYRQKARERGRIHDRDEPDFIAQRAYGVTTHAVNRTHWSMSFNQLPRELMAIRVMKDRSVSLFRNHGKEKVYCIYLHDRQVLGVPKVDYVDVTVFDVKTKQKRTEQLKN